jgi:integrase
MVVARKRRHVSATADVLKTQLCLGARVGEVCGLTVDELKQDVSGRLLWTLPAARSKNGRARVTPIVGLAREIIEARLKAAGQDGRLFVAVSGVSLTTSLVGQAIIQRWNRLPIEKFSSHDLRRSLAVSMTKLGISLEVVALAIGHEAGAKVTRTLVRHYLHDDFIDRKAAALAQWEAASGDPSRRGRRRQRGRFSGQIVGSTNLCKGTATTPCCDVPAFCPCSTVL